MTLLDNILSSKEISNIFFDESLDPCVIFNLEGKLTNVNNALLTALNYQKNELLGKPVFMIIADQDIQRAKNDLKDFGSGQQFKQWHGYFKKKDGSTFPVLVSANQIYKEKSIIGGFAIIKDITELENAKTELLNFRLALDNSASVAITDTNGMITYANDMFCKLSKYSKDELVGKNHRILKSGHHDDSFYKNLWNTITSGKIWHGDIKNKAKDETYNWVRTMIMPVFDDDNKIINYMAIRIDITSQVKLAERLVKAERLSSIGALASRMSHDLRNPLSVIQVSLENMKMLYGGDEMQVKQFEKIERSITRMTHQVDGVLDFVRRRPLEFTKTLFSEIIRESMDSLIIPNNVKILLPKNDIRIRCDKKQFSIALNNLILNSIQAIDGTGTIELSVEENNNKIVIQVKDSGKGISKEDMNKIFEPLFTTKQQGTGLGLAGVNFIVDSHKGIISVTSPPTIFTITLPNTAD